MLGIPPVGRNYGNHDGLLAWVTFVSYQLKLDLRAQLFTTPNGQKCALSLMDDCFPRKQYATVSRGMDPISFIASLLALCGAVGQISKAVRAVHSGLQNADEEVDQAVQQIGVIRLVVGRLADLNASFKKDGHHSSNLDRAEVTEIIEALRGVVADIEAAFPLDTLLTPFRRRLRWVRKDKAIVDKLMSRLDAAWNTLNIVLQVERL
jgi:hypothetical protein